MTDCQHSDSDVKDSRPSHLHGHYVIRRRRKCRACGVRFTTIEATMPSLVRVLASNVETKIKKALSDTCKNLYAEVLKESLGEDLEAEMVRPGVAIVRYPDQSKGRAK